MTRQANNPDKFTEFSNWLRQQNEISSSSGYIASNLDYVWENYNTGHWMLIEEKRNGALLSPCQKKMFKKITTHLHDEKFKGFHFIQFQKTNPDDGLIWWNHKKITKEQLIERLQFKNLDGGYFNQNKEQTA